jgi:transcriptional regulator with XRE-family HTH domain
MNEETARALAELGMRFTQARARKRWTLLALARRAGLGRTTVSQTVNARAIPSVETITCLADALSLSAEPLLALRSQALAAVEATRPAERHDSDVIIDLGDVSPPNQYVAHGEVRFSVSNYRGVPVKVTSIALVVAGRKPDDTSAATQVAAPIDEYYLFARVEQDTQTVELLDRQHLLEPGETDGFFLKIEAVEGWVYELLLEVSWHDLGAGDGQKDRTIRTVPFTLPFPARSARALIELARRLGQDREELSNDH